jgi:hypothetical protein
MQTGHHLLKQAFFSTINTKLAAALATLGFKPYKNLPATNHYDGETAPIPKVSKDHPSWQPGIVTWYFEPDGTFMGKSIEKLIVEYGARDADGKMDKVVQEIIDLIQQGANWQGEYTPEEIALALQEGCKPRHKRIENLAAQLIDLLPAVIVSYISGGLENREIMNRAIKIECDELVAIRKGEGMQIMKLSKARERARKGEL